MNIQDALKETGKAINKAEFGGFYAMPNEVGILCLYNRKTNIIDGGVSLRSTLLTDWQPYHEKPEIRPKEAGELWKHEPGGLHLHTDDGPAQQLCMVGWNGPERHAIDTAIHGQNGWTRICPSVPDESVERIEFDNIEWALSECWQKRPMPHIAMCGKDWGTIRDVIANKPPMKMVLEIPKIKG